jgi:thiamine pyrophosphokinase
MQEDASTPTHERICLFKQSSHNILMSYNYSKQSSHNICCISETTQFSLIEKQDIYIYNNEKQCLFLVEPHTGTERNNGTDIKIHLVKFESPSTDVRPSPAVNTNLSINIIK